MGLPRFFRLAKPRQFHYEPVFYDERSEKMQERIREAEKRPGVSSDGQFKSTLTRGSISSRHHVKTRTGNKSAIRLIIIFLFLLLISYLLLYF